MDEHTGGMTWFLRCGACGEMYVPATGWNWQTGKQVAYWLRPRLKRKPTPCAHDGRVERWDGTAWVPVEITKESQGGA